MKKATLTLAIAVFATAAQAQSCPHGAPVRVIGDVPGAISYDVFSHLYPLNADVLARMSAAQQITMIPDGTIACTITDDGVPNPGAVLIAGPHGNMNYWLSSASVKPLK
ncbi:MULTISPECIES: hypothetical protein [unclassified Paraburkholderia]|uniref:hypothetical protein n=1 Tax=unclassified Paraburkholderia TaxID=2615204 RepID=UPI00197F3368|nr:MULTISPECIES: hypothetical protein [unclassified Paraburkholderia]MBN3857926.1 hypothetical protein [Paraburkholderia sp. Ac-20340]